MSATPQPEVFLTPEAHQLKLRKKNKPIFFIILAILILAALIFGIIKLRTPIQKNLSSVADKIKTSDKIFSSLKGKPEVIRPQVAKQRNTSTLAESHPTLFFADLEYDPQTGIVTQKATGLTNGDPVYLSPNPPNALNDKFVYKIEVSTAKGIIESGWGQAYKEIAQTKEGRLQFRINVFYQPKALVKVYLPNEKLIWTGQMQGK